MLSPYPLESLKGSEKCLATSRGILVAVPVHGHDAVGVLVHHRAPGVHAEGADGVLILLRAVDDLALVELVGDVRKDLGGQFDADPDVHAVRAGPDVEVPADLLHPLAAAPSRGDDAPAAFEAAFRGAGPEAVLRLLHRLDRAVEAEFDLVLQMVVKMLQDDVVDIRPQMAYGRVEQMQPVLHAGLLEGRARGRIELRPLPAEAEVDPVDVFHELRRGFLADVFVERPAEVVRDIVLAVGERAGAPEAAHDRAAVAVDAGADLYPVDRASAAVEPVPGLEHGDLQPGAALHQFVGGIDAAGARPDDQHVIHF